MYSERIKRIQEKLNDLNLDGLFISAPLNIYYLTGFIGVSLVERETTVLVRKDKLVFFVPTIYKQEGDSAAKTPEIEVQMIEERHLLFSEPAKTMMKGEKIGFESTNLRFSEYTLLKDNSEAEFIPTTSIVEDIRIIKDDLEIELAQKAVDITDMTYDFLTKNVKRGMTEKQVSKMIQTKMEELGADGVSFDALVASGPDSSIPHYKPSDKVIGEGILLIDMGARYKGYMGDLTRTMYVGKPDQKFLDTYELVKKAEETAIAQTKSGMACEDSWKIANDIFGDQAQYFIHGLGHGLGLDIHEDPYLRKGITKKLPNKCFVTIEPGLYYPGWGGIRIEDYCLITNEGSKVMSKATKEIITL